MECVAKFLFPNPQAHSYNCTQSWILVLFLWENQDSRVVSQPKENFLCLQFSRNINISLTRWLLTDKVGCYNWKTKRKKSLSVAVLLKLSRRNGCPVESQWGCVWAIEKICCLRKHIQKFLSFLQLSGYQWDFTRSVDLLHNVWMAISHHGVKS